MNWYKLTVEDTLKNYQTSTEGLSQEERQKRLTDQGYNEIEARQQTKRWKKIVKHFTDRVDHCLFFEICFERIHRRKYYFIRSDRQRTR